MESPGHDLIALALEEDIGRGDITSDFFIPETLHSAGRVVAREKLIVAGAATAAEVFKRVDPNLHIDIPRGDGTEAAPEDTVLEVRGLARSILKA